MKNIILIILPFGFIIVILYYASFINFEKLHAEIEIEHWADNLRGQEGVGRNCSHVNYNDINSIFDSMGRINLEDTNGIVELSINCFKNMKLIEMNYYARYNVVSGIYRCEKDDMLQELRLSIYLEPRSVPQKTDCMKGEFYKDWNIPVGKATMFSLP